MKTALKLLVAALACASSVSAQAVSYSVTNLGALGTRYGNIFDVDLNEAGQVAGTIGGAGGVVQAAVWSDGAWNPLSPGVESWAVGLNDLGHVVGTTLVNGREVATVWKNGSAQLLPGFSDESGSGAHDINNAGQIIGRSNVSYPNGRGGPRAVLWTDGKPAYLPGPADQMGGYSYATDINEAGQIIGFSDDAGPFKGTRWDNGVASWVGGQASGINNHGTAVGYMPDGHDWPAMIWSSAGAVRVDAASNFKDFNDAGLAVGSVWSAVGSEQRAITYLNGQVLDLNTLITGAPADLKLLENAVAVNNQGQIVVLGKVESDPWGTHAFVLTPVPEPEHYAMLLLGLGMVGFAARRKAGNTTTA